MRRPAVLDGQLRRAGRRHVRHRSGHAHRARLLHLPRVDRGERVRPRRRHAVRGRAPRRRSCAASRRSARRSPRRRRRPARRSPTPSSSRGLGALSATVERRAVRAVPDARRRSAATARRSPTSGARRHRRRHVHDRADDAGEGRLLHLPGVDRGDATPTTASTTAVRRGRRDDVRPREAGGHDRRVGRRRAAGLVDLRPHPGDRARADPGDDRGAPVRPVRLARGDRLRRHAVLEGHGRRRRATARPTRRRSSSRARASTRTASGSSGRRASRRRRPPAARRSRRRSRRRSSSPAAAIASCAPLRRRARRRRARPSRRACGSPRAGSTRASTAWTSTRAAARSRSRRTSTASAGGATARRPDRETGAILLAGHIDSAKRGAGAFYALKNARRGDTVTVTSDDGKTRELPRDDDAARAQGRAAGEHLLAHRAAAGSCSSRAAGRSTRRPATTATTSSSPRSRAEQPVAAGPKCQPGAPGLGPNGHVLLARRGLCCPRLSGSPNGERRGERRRSDETRRPLRGVVSLAPARRSSTSQKGR